MKKERCCVCKQYFPKNRLLFDYCSGNHFCLNCYKNRFTAKQYFFLGQRLFNLKKAFNYGEEKIVAEKITEEETAEKGTADKRRTDENVIYVGSKPPMSYVLAVVTQFNGGSDEVVIKARGRAISRAVDAAEITRNRFIKDAEIKDIKIGTESMINEEGRTSNVSSIEIYLITKNKSKQQNRRWCCLMTGRKH